MKNQEMQKMVKKMKLIKNKKSQEEGAGPFNTILIIILLLLLLFVIGYGMYKGWHKSIISAIEKFFGG